MGEYAVPQLNSAIQMAETAVHGVKADSRHFECCGTRKSRGKHVRFTNRQRVGSEPVYDTLTGLLFHPSPPLTTKHIKRDEHQ
jgi:hypothetical protein